MSMEVQKAVHAEFRLHGLSLKRESIKLIVAYVDDQNVSVEDAAELILNALQKQERAQYSRPTCRLDNNSFLNESCTVECSYLCCYTRVCMVTLTA
jgi:hypothetical protein